jgi:hypothetical protein
VMVAHRLLYPSLHHIIWLINAHKVIKNKKLLLTLGCIFCLAAYRGQGFWDGIMKLVGLTNS